MILVDVGNTSIHFALGKNHKIAKIWQLDSQSATLAQIEQAIDQYRSLGRVVVCSVVPRVTKLFEQIPNAAIVGKDIQVPIKCRYNVKQVGQDRLVAAYAAKKLYSDVRIVIDFGTAITFDILSLNGDYEGGIILPGVGSTMRTLANCAMLPKHMRLRYVKAMIPRNTEESINKGMDSGFSAMLNGLIADYKKALRISKPDSVVVTGGEGFFIARKLESKCILDESLVLKGLALLGD